MNSEGLGEGYPDLSGSTTIKKAMFCVRLPLNTHSLLILCCRLHGIDKRERGRSALDSVPSPLWSCVQPSVGSRLTRNPFLGRK